MVLANRSASARAGAGEQIAVDVEFPWIAPGAVEPIPMSAVEWFTFRDGRIVEMSAATGTPRLAPEPCGPRRGLTRAGTTRQ